MTLPIFKIIKNANIYAPKALGICDILIAGEVITYIGSEMPNLSPNLDVEVKDLCGATLIPGFIDAHAHIIGGGGETGYSSPIPPVPLSKFTSAGVTSVVGLLGTDDLVKDTKSLVARAYALRGEGLSAWCYTGGYHFPLTTLTGNAKSDIVFIDPVIGIGELALSDHRSSQITQDDFFNIASQAHVASIMTGKAGILHIHMGDGERGLSLIRDALSITEIPPRIFNPTHINRNQNLFSEALNLSKQGCNVDITAFPEGHNGNGFSASEAFMKYRDGGYPMDKMTISSDSGGCLPHFDKFGELLDVGVGDSSTLIITLKELLAAGIKIEDILPALTSNIANLLRLNKKGVIKQGNDADLVVFDDNNNIKDVMARGNWHICDGDVKIYGTYENV